MLCPVVLSHGTFPISRVPLAPEVWLSTTAFPGSALVFTGTECKGKGAACAGWARQTGHSWHGWVLQAGRKHVQGSGGGWGQRLEGFKDNSPLFKRSNKVI